MAWEEARTLHPKPDILVFAAFQFDAEAAKDIDELTKEKTGMTFLTAQMNADLLTDDLKKKRSSNQSFWLVGRPDVELTQIKSGAGQGKVSGEGATASITTTPAPAPSFPATPKISPCGCWIRITTGEASTRARSFSRWRTTTKAGPSWPRI